jgi:hypothetical protein
MVNPEVVCHPSIAKNHRYACQQLATFLVWLIFAAPYQANRK